jgi:hypothetical protein
MRIWSLGLRILWRSFALQGKYRGNVLKYNTITSFHVPLGLSRTVTESYLFRHGVSILTVTHCWYPMATSKLIFAYVWSSGFQTASLPSSFGAFLNFHVYKAEIFNLFFFEINTFQIL